MVIHENKVGKIFQQVWAFINISKTKYSGTNVLIK